MVRFPAPPLTILSLYNCWKGLFIMAWLYIPFSKSVNKYYVGITTEEPQKRLEKHNIKYYKNQHTSIADDSIG
ncbi:MAG: hypothetical protein EBZ58_06480 [Bacteroidetes bacterium]|nr:hypothetical protein [Bacteroidota bacterium]